jgi:hypothetical protein
VLGAVVTADSRSSNSKKIMLVLNLGFVKHYAMKKYAVQTTLYALVISP